MKTYTREQYMNKEVSHHDYYLGLALSQGATIDTDMVKRVKNSTCENLNDIPLAEWDLLGSMKPIYEMYRDGKAATSASTSVCAYKALARHLADTMPQQMFIQGKNKILFGTRKEDNARIYLSKPSFDCGWYWSFGYLGNNNEHYHLESYAELCSYPHNVIRNKGMKECLVEDYKLSPTIEDNIWSFCEQAMTIYTLNKAAKVLYCGGSNQTNHPLRDFIGDNFKDDYLNKEVLPKLLQRFWNDFGGNK